jgi:riboflavin kinase / FMN adenylyltransferase
MEVLQIEVGKRYNVGMHEGKHISSLAEVTDDQRGCVLTIGKFDGVHHGHRELIACARQIADDATTAGGVYVPLVAMLFWPSPEAILWPDRPWQTLSTLDQRIRRLLSCGVDAVVTVEPTVGFLSLPPETFVDAIVVETFAACAVVEGPDFSYGRDRGGSLDDLRDAGEEHGFSVHCIEPHLIDVEGSSHRVSSTQIRRLISEGAVELAAELLDGPFELAGDVVTGRGVGRELEFPTANLHVGDQVVPDEGVYAGVAILDGARHVAAISIGTAPTIPSEQRLIEAYLLDYPGADLYGQTIELQFHHRLRSQKRFDSREALQHQIQQDVAHVRSLVQL